MPSAPTSVLASLLTVYVFLCFGLLVLLLATRWAWWLKALMVALTTVFYFVGQQAFWAVAGWPSEQDLPRRFVLLSAVFDEPNPQRGHDGAIHVWLTPLDDETPAPQPRAYRLPYEKDLRRILDDGLRKTRDGNTQLGSAEPVRGPRAGSLAWLLPSGESKVKITLKDLPRVQLPEK